MIKITQDINLDNYTLILPSVAVGNVGQLSVDLLISNLNLRKIGQVFSTAFVPIVGANAYDEYSKELITAIDIYAGIKERLIVIQIRSPYVNILTQFFNELEQFVVERKIAKVIILASSYDHEKKEVLPQHLKLRYIASPNVHSEYGKLFRDLNWIEHKLQTVSDINREERLHIPGGGFAMNIFEFLSNANICCSILFKFCSEGDNIIDAIALVCYLDQWIQVLGSSSDSSNNSSLKYPPSWKHLFGKPPQYDMY
ncbi:proteasome assembly chaperone 2 [Harpegnathos saltator]|uniref:Proteasome assembly chaperone 2 n=1 Tax=Harpegnathos saltator TaxID=610380 RepID=E2BWU4_HARSA|nr:proteasome assembly chaperone 2 [Harpegnathos saltator]EFN79808.1 Proteasome assembly chaperone 2 [Harpegnathos saltator]